MSMKKEQNTDQKNTDKNKAGPRNHGEIDGYVKAWLHRRGTFCWEFTPNKIYGLLTHTTKYGTVYAIIHDQEYSKPFWIARLHENKWLTFERELKAVKIEFDNGGEYTFPT